MCNKFVVWPKSVKPLTGRFIRQTQFYGFNHHNSLVQQFFQLLALISIIICLHNFCLFFVPSMWMRGTVSSSMSKAILCVDGFLLHFLLTTAIYMSRRMTNRSKLDCTFGMIVFSNNSVYVNLSLSLFEQHGLLKCNYVVIRSV